jgi:hypothetical protein
LVHHFSGALLKGHESEFVAIGNFDGFREAEAVNPEGDDGLDLVYEQDWGDAFYVHEASSPVIDSRAWKRNLKTARER